MLRNRPQWHKVEGSLSFQRMVELKRRSVATRHCPAVKPLEHICLQILKVVSDGSYLMPNSDATKTYFSAH